MSPTAVWTVLRGMVFGGFFLLLIHDPHFLRPCFCAVNRFRRGRLHDCNCFFDNPFFRALWCTEHATDSLRRKAIVAQNFRVLSTASWSRHVVGWGARDPDRHRANARHVLQLVGVS